MNYLFENPSLEVATNSSFLQNAAYQLRQFWIKRMLPVLVSILCVSCGSSGVPSEPESTSSLQSSESVSAISATDPIIGPGFSGYSVAQAQAPTLNAAQPLLLAAAETEISAPGQSVSSALQALGSVISSPEPVVAQPTTSVPVASATIEVEEPPTAATTPEANKTPDAGLSPEAAVELAELEAELAALPPIETLPVVEPKPAEEPVANIDEGGAGTTSNTFSYESIEANGLGNGTYPTDDYYLAEFLYQNPDVCFWEQDAINKTITSLKTPAPPEDSVYIPSPTGGDDTSMLEAFFQKNTGKSVVGQGTYMVKTLDINKAIDIYNMPMVPAAGAKQMVRVGGPDVRIFNSPIDGKNSGSLAIGFNIEDGAHRFVLVNSGVKDFYHKNGEMASAVFIRGANDFHIVCNRFENIINDTYDKSKIARASSIWLHGRNEHQLTGGLIANNDAKNNQSNSSWFSSMFFVVQNYNTISKDNPLRVFANRAVDTGKRFSKSQEGDTLFLSNYIDWSSLTGPLGTRKLLYVFEIHQSNNVYIRNNRVSIGVEGRFDAIFQTDASTGSHTAHLGGSTQDNIHFDNNDVELKDNRDPNAKTGPIMVSATASHADLQAVGHEATNSSANNNNVHGAGSLKSYFLFRNGYDDGGGRFEHKNNVFSVPAYHSDYLRF